MNRSPANRSPANRPRRRAGAGTVVFCPFCRESFEEEETCPEHELPLVPFDRLPAEAGDEGLDEHERLAAYDPRLGRGWVMAGALLLIVAPAFSFVTTVAGDAATATGYQLALARALNLWMVPCAGFALVAILFRRRSPAAMRGARLVVPMLGLLSASAVGYTFWRVYRGIPGLAARLGVDVSVRPEVGVWLVGLGVLLVIVGGLRLGVLPSRA